MFNFAFDRGSNRGASEQTPLSKLEVMVEFLREKTVTERRRHVVIDKNTSGPYGNTCVLGNAKRARNYRQLDAWVKSGVFGPKSSQLLPGNAGPRRINDPFRGASQPADASKA